MRNKSTSHTPDNTSEEGNVADKHINWMYSCLDTDSTCKNNFAFKRSRITEIQPKAITSIDSSTQTDMFPELEKPIDIDPVVNKIVNTNYEFKNQQSTEHIVTEKKAEEDTDNIDESSYETAALGSDDECSKSDTLEENGEQTVTEYGKNIHQNIQLQCEEGFRHQELKDCKFLADKENSDTKILIHAPDQIAESDGEYNYETAFPYSESEYEDCVEYSCKQTNCIVQHCKHSTQNQTCKESMQLTIAEQKPKPYTTAEKRHNEVHFPDSVVEESDLDQANFSSTDVKFSGTSTCLSSEPDSEVNS